MHKAKTAFLRRRGIPGGRPGFFDGTRTASPSLAFRNAVTPAAQKAFSILPSEDRDVYFEYVSSLDPTWDYSINWIKDHLTGDVDKSDPEVAAKLEWGRKRYTNLTPSRVYFAEFLMDMGACAALDRDEYDTFPIVDDKFIDAYGELQNAIFAQHPIDFQKANEIHNPARYHNIHRGREKILISHINDLFHTNLLKWSEVRELKKRIGRDIRNYYRLRVQFDSMDISVRMQSVRAAKLAYTIFEEIAKPVVAGSHTMLMNYLAPGLIDPSNASSILKQSYGISENEYDNAIDNVPFVIKNGLSPYIGNKTSEIAGHLVDAGIYSIRINGKMTKLLKKSLFNVTSIGKIAMNSVEITIVSEELQKSM